MILLDLPTLDTVRNTRTHVQASPTAKPWRRGKIWKKPNEQWSHAMKRLGSEVPVKRLMIRGDTAHDNRIM